MGSSSGGGSDGNRGVDRRERGKGSAMEARRGGSSRSAREARNRGGGSASDGNDAACHGGEGSVSLPGRSLGRLGGLLDTRSRRANGDAPFGANAPGEVWRVGPEAGGSLDRGEPDRRAADGGTLELGGLLDRGGLDALGDSPRPVRRSPLRRRGRRCADGGSSSSVTAGIVLESRARLERLKRLPQRPQRALERLSLSVLRSRRSR